MALHTPERVTTPLPVGATATVPAPSGQREASISWSAVLAGAATAAALSLILLMLGVGLGLSSVSPWSGAGISAGALGISTIAWLTVTQLLASGAGGYLAGRLRPKSPNVPEDEAYFRDTAHGFLAWSVASIATAALLGSVVSSIVGGGVQAGASVTGGAVQAAGASVSAAARNAAPQGAQMLPYFVDQLFRENTLSSAESNAGAASGSGTPERTAEALRIFSQAFQAGSLNADDVHHLGSIVSRQTGLPVVEAEKRVTTVYAAAQARLKEAETAVRNAADEARQLSARTMLWMFISLLIGAFIASLSATLGGRHQHI
jgi:hypothetical protein